MIEIIFINIDILINSIIREKIVLRLNQALVSTSILVNKDMFKILKGMKQNHFLTLNLEYSMASSQIIVIRNIPQIGIL
jgi:hypothetical protein